MPVLLTNKVEMFETQCRLPTNIHMHRPDGSPKLLSKSARNHDL